MSVAHRHDDRSESSSHIALRKLDVRCTFNCRHQPTTGRGGYAEIIGALQNTGAFKFSTGLMLPSD